MINEYNNIKIINSKKTMTLFYVIFYLFCFIFWAVIYYKMIMVKNTGDYYIHNQFSILMMEGKFETIYPGYQLVVGIPYVITKININYISIVVLSFFSVFTVYVTSKLLIELLNNKEENKYYIMILSFLLNIIQPIFTYSIRPGYSSGNGYISPTQAVCKPFVLLTFIYTYRMYKNDNYEKKNQILLFLNIFMSIIMKPAFAMAYIPAIGILYFVDEIIKNNSLKYKIKSYINKIWPLFFSGLVMIVQYLLSFHLKMPDDTKYNLKEGAGIKIGFLVAWKSVISNVPLSILFAYLFPIVLLISLMIAKSKKLVSITMKEKKFFNICIIYGVISILYMSFLYQELCISDCNFRNAWVMTFSVIQIFCISILYRITKENFFSLKLLFLNWGVFSVHVIMGIALYIKNII